MRGEPLQVPDHRPARGRRSGQRRSPPSATAPPGARPHARSDSPPWPSGRRRTGPSSAPSTAASATPPPRRVGQAQQRRQRRGHAALLRLLRDGDALFTSRTTRSACSTSSGRWAIRSTVRPTPRRRYRVRHDLHAPRVEVRRRLVEQHERCVLEKRARQADAPALAGRQRASAIADLRRIGRAAAPG